MATATNTSRPLPEQCVRIAAGYGVLWNAVMRAEVPAERVGGRWYISDSAADAWVGRRGKPAGRHG
jgi:hypothetical protein